MKPDTTIAPPTPLRPALFVTVLTLLLALAGAFLSVMIAPEPARAQGGATASCAVDADTACIQGSIRTSEGEPASGVSPKAAARTAACQARNELWLAEVHALVGREVQP